MTTLLVALSLVIRVTQLAFLVLAVGCLIVCVVDWLARTRRISPFGAAARFSRRTIDPLLEPIERRVVRAGGAPGMTPWWALLAIVIAGILVISLLQFVQGEVFALASAMASGPRGILAFLVGATIGVLQVAILVRVFASWIPALSPYSPWVRWAYTISEPILAPLRSLIPPIGGAIDITPLLAYFVLGLLRGWLVGLVA